jgi:uncharacterized protein (DUF1501 family)
MTSRNAMTDRNRLNRRQFLAGAGALGASAAFGVGRVGAATPARRSLSVRHLTGTAATQPTLVLVTLYGGNDALNTVVPTGDPQYAARRGALALDPSSVLDIGDGFGLHPSLARSKALWDEGRLAAVHGVGFGELDRSHFHCMDVWQAGSEDDLSTGWVGRWLDLVSDDPLDAVAVGTNLPLLLRGERRAAAVVPAGPLSVPGGDALADAVSVLGGDAVSDGSLAALVAGSTADLLTIVGTVGPLLDDAPTTGDDDVETGLGASLDAVATMIEHDLPTRLYSVDLRGFDTHAGQAPVHAALLGELDAALGSFVARMADRPVTVAVYSEFGRRVAPNASDGTDHGGGGTMLLAGRVVPGHHGEPPPLDALVDGDLATTTDFRSVLAGLVGDVLGVDPTDIFDHAGRPLQLV